MPEAIRAGPAQLLSTGIAGLVCLLLLAAPDEGMVRVCPERGVGTPQGTACGCERWCVWITKLMRSPVQHRETSLAGPLQG